MEDTGDDLTRLVRLLARIEQTPLFLDNLDDVLECAAEAADLDERTVGPARVEAIALLRRAEIFLARGAVTSAFETAGAARTVAERNHLLGLVDWAALVEARALVRLSRRDEAVALFHAVVGHTLPLAEEEPCVPGLAFLAVGEAHLFEGHYERAYEPLEHALALLPTGRFADRLRYDALVGLGMLDHRAADFEAAALRYAAAATLAERHGSRPERTVSLLLEACLLRGLGRVDDARTRLSRALVLSVELTSPARSLAFPTERLHNLVGFGDTGTLIDSALDLAGDCGGDGDLMGYVQLCALVATVLDLDGRSAEARRMLAEVAGSLTDHGQHDAAAALNRHAAGYR